MLPAAIKNLPPEKIVVLVDGSSYLFRAYYAPHLGALTATDGTPTGAIYGVLTMIRRLESLLSINRWSATPSACFVMDEKGGSFRNELYPQYKAHRGAPPEDLIAQIGPLRTIIPQLGWPHLAMAGYEADDLIATLVQRAKAEGKTTVIVTGDKDFAQLVDERVFLLDTMKDEWLDAEGVRQKFGVPPERIIDYLSLLGDASDNVPGVDKVGAKTAVKLITEYGSLDEVMKHADSIKGVIGENLNKARSWLPLTRTLITLKDDVPLPDDFSWHFQPAHNQALREWYVKLGFKKLLAEMDGNSASKNINGPAPIKKATLPDLGASLFAIDEAPIDETGAHKPAHPIEHQRLDEQYFTLIVDGTELMRWVEKIRQASLLAVDTETTGLNPHLDTIVGISLSTDGQSACYIPINHVDERGERLPEQLAIEEVVRALSPIFADEHIAKTGHHLRFDRHLLARYGLSINGIAHDTALASFVWSGHERHGLENIAERWLGLGGMSFDSAVATSTHKKNFAGVPLNVATRYASEDAALAWLCARHAEKLLASEPRLMAVYRLEIAVSEVLFQMESNGISINADFLRSYSQELLAQGQVLERQAHELAGVPFNLASPKQLQEILFERMGINSTKKTAKGAASTNEEVLESLADEYPIARVILNYRQCAKLNNTYAEVLPKEVNPRTGRIHTRFSQLGAITGRLSSNDPNVQNIPIKTPEGRKIRTAFVPQKGWTLISADYSQIELRVMAHCADDATMCAAFAEGADIHRKTAAEVFHINEQEVTTEQRRYAKAINFGLIYGMGAFGLAKAIGVPRHTAQEFIERYFARYPAIRAWMDNTIRLASAQGYVDTLYGRRIHINGINSVNAIQRQAAGRFAINAPIQGSAADIIKLAMVEVHSALRSGGYRALLLLQVHDELVLECPPEEAESLRQLLPVLMKKPAQTLAIRVPLEVNVGIGDNWDAAH